jgi:hypothetical protein
MQYLKSGAVVLCALGALLTTTPVLAQSSCKPLKPMASIAMTRTAGGRIILPVKMNGGDTNVLFTTGGANSIFPEAAKALKLPVRNVGGLVTTDGKKNRPVGQCARAGAGPDHHEG